MGSSNIHGIEKQLTPMAISSFSAEHKHMGPFFRLLLMLRSHPAKSCLWSDRAPPGTMSRPRRRLPPPAPTSRLKIWWRPPSRNGPGSCSGRQKAKRALAAAKRKANKAKPPGGTAFQLSFVWAPDTRLRPAASHHRDVAGRAHGVEAPYPQIYTFCLGSKPLHGVGFGFQTFRWCCHITQTKAALTFWCSPAMSLWTNCCLTWPRSQRQSLRPCCLIQGGQPRRDPACRGSVVRDHAARMAHARSKRARGMDETLMACLWFWLCIFSWALWQDRQNLRPHQKTRGEKQGGQKAPAPGGVGA